MESKSVLEVCGCNIVHEDVIERVRGEMPDEDTIYNLSEFFKVFGDSTRLKIIKALMESEMCVCDLTALLGMNQSAVSHQLKLLRQTKLVKFRRMGKVVYYSLDDEHISHIYKMGIIHVNEK